MSDATAGQQNGGQDNQGGNTGTGGAAGGSGGTAGSDSGSGSGAGAPWHGVTDPDVSAYITNKGWTDVGSVVKSYRDAEKFIGRDPNTLLSLPRADDPVGMRAVFERLGAPKEAKGYEIDQPNDLPQDPAYQDWAKQTFHKLGLTAAQAKGLSAEHNAYLRQVSEQAAKDYDLNVASDKKALEREWGGGYDRMLGRAKLAANELGFSQEVVDAIEEKLGFAGTMKLFAEMGGKMGEDTFVGGKGTSPRFSGAMTPAEAKAEWDAMKLDPNLVKALQDNQHPGHSVAKEKQTRLFKIMYPE